MLVEAAALTDRSRVEAFLDDCTAILDEDRLEAWPDLFVEDGVYKVLSRENLALGLPAPLVYYYSRGMMRDRVVAIRDALTFEFVWHRHMTSNLRVEPAGEGRWTATSNFVLYQATEEGRTRCYAVGQYRDLIVEDDAGLRFRERTVVLDSFGVQNLIAVPL